MASVFWIGSFVPEARGINAVFGMRGVGVSASALRHPASYEFMIEVCATAMATPSPPQLIPDWYHACIANK